MPIKSATRKVRVAEHIRAAHVADAPECCHNGFRTDYLAPDHYGASGPVVDECLAGKRPCSMHECYHLMDIPERDGLNVALDGPAVGCGWCVECACGEACPGPDDPRPGGTWSDSDWL